MNIYLSIYLIIFILGFVVNELGTKNAKKYYVCICILMYLLLNSLRSLTVGADTQNYYYMFKSVITMPWSQIWTDFASRYFYHTISDDIGYVVFVKLITYLTHDFHVFTFIAESLFFIPLGIFLYRYSSNIYQLIFAFILYGALLNAIPITNCRQTYAFGICIITVIMYLENYNKRMIPVLIVLAATIHLSALLFFLPYTLLFFSRSIRRIHMWALLLVPIVVFNPNSIIRFMGGMSGKEQYAGYGEVATQGGVYSFVILLELLSVYIYFSYMNVHMSKMSSRQLLLYCMVPCFTFFGPLIVSNGTMIRISMYFHIFLVLLVPMATSLLFKRSENVYNLCMSVILVFWSIISNDYYYFFWEIDNPLTW